MCFVLEEHLLASPSFAITCNSPLAPHKICLTHQLHVYCVIHSESTAGIRRHIHKLLVIPFYSFLILKKKYKSHCMFIAVTEDALSTLTLLKIGCFVAVCKVQEISVRDKHQFIWAWAASTFSKSKRIYNYFWKNRGNKSTLHVCNSRDRLNTSFDSNTHS